MKRRLKLTILFLLTLLLFACDPMNKDLNENNSNFEETMYLDHSQIVDVRLIPEWSQLELSFKDMYQNKITEYYGSKQVINKKDRSLHYNVNQFEYFEVQADNGEELDFVILLIDLTVTNLSNQEQFFSAEDLILSSLTPSNNININNQIYPLQNGNLTNIMKENHNKIESNGVVNGYLAYQIPSDLWRDIETLEFALLSNKELLIPIPTNFDQYLRLKAQDRLIQDYFLTNYIGEKGLIIEDFSKSTFLSNSIDTELKINRIELTELNPYIDDYFKVSDDDSNPLILSMEISIKNLTGKPIDLEIYGGKIDNLILNQEYQFLDIQSRNKIMLEAGKEEKHILTFILNPEIFKQGSKVKHLAIAIGIGKFEVFEATDWKIFNQDEIISKKISYRKNYYYDFLWKPWE